MSNIRDLTPKTGLTFKTFEESRAFVDNYALKHKFVLVLRNTNKTKEGIYTYASLTCDKYGTYVGKKSETSTKRTNCPFAIKVGYRRKENIYIITSVSLEHNHILVSEDLQFTCAMRKLTVDELGKNCLFKFSVYLMIRIRNIV